jgi:hypothetical protein
MTDNDDLTEARVRAAFAAEFRRAETDIELSPVRVGPRPEDRRPGGPELRRFHRLRTAVRIAAIAAAIVLAVGLGFIVAGPRNAANPEAASPSAATPEAITQIPRYSDGIPTVWLGQPVLRWNDALARRRTATDATPFLVGVWLNIDTGPESCPAQFANPSAPNSWIRIGGCLDNPISADAGGTADDLNGVATFQFAVGDIETGPAILRVHVHDARSSDCGPQQDICDRMIVVEQAVWAGDAGTAPHPLSVAQVIAATGEVSPTSDLRGPSPDVWGCGADVTDGLLLCPPSQSSVQFTSPIAGAAVLPSSDAVARALPSVTPGVGGALQSSAVVFTEGGWAYRRLIVDNVVILVISGQSDSDREFLNQLVAALKAREASPTATG